MREVSTSLVSVPIFSLIFLAMMETLRELELDPGGNNQIFPPKMANYQEEGPFLVQQLHIPDWFGSLELEGSRR